MWVSLQRAAVFEVPSQKRLLNQKNCRDLNWWFGMERWAIPFTDIFFLMSCMQCSQAIILCMQLLNEYAHLCSILVVFINIFISSVLKDGYSFPSSPMFSTLVHQIYLSSMTVTACVHLKQTSLSLEKSGVVSVQEQPSSVGCKYTVRFKKVSKLGKKKKILRLRNTSM